MKKEPGMVGWPAKTLAINTIDLHPSDVGEARREREADEKNGRRK